MPANVGTAYVTIMPSTKGFSKALASAGGKAGKASGAAFSADFGGALSKLGKVGAVALGGIATGLGAIGAGAMGAYADFEQLQGGVQKLFGGSWKTVMANAQEAYRTSGVSANQYMEQVTSFSASLISSLGGDTKRAAELSNLAMTSMADNVNVFGSSMEDVQNAFQGFAKQNYTMLDNLKLGYGGTKTEMQRLVRDASQLKDVQEELGVTVDANSLSFDNVVSAIAVMQKKMKIAGTTTKEAMSTISGSIGMARAAWTNWLTGLADDGADMGKLTDNLVESLGAVADNVGKRVGIIGSRIVAALPSVARTVADAIPQIAMPIIGTAFDTVAASVEGLLRGIGIDVPAEFVRWGDVTDAFNEVVDAARGFADSFSAAFEGTGALGSLADIGDKLGDLGQKLGDLLPDVDEVKGAFEDLGGTMGTAIGDGVNAASGALDDIGEKLGWLSDHIGEIGDVVGPVAVGLGIFAGSLGAVAVASGLVSLSGLTGGIAALIGSLPVVTALTGAWSAATALAGDAWALLTLLFEASPLGMVVLGITAVVTALALFFTQTETGRKLWAAFTGWLSETWASLSSAASSAFEAAKAAISEKVQAAVTTATSMWDGAKSAITEKWNAIKTSVSNAANGLKTSVKEKLTAAKNAVVNAFNGVKERLTAPFTAAKNTISNVIGGIKRMFPFNIGRILSLKLPHISVSGGKAPWGIGGKGSLPHFSVSWYAKGGIFDSPSVIGVGEAGKEAVVPIDKLRGYIADAMGGAGTTYNVYLNDLAVNDDAAIVGATRGYLYELKRLGAI